MQGRSSTSTLAAATPPPPPIAVEATIGGSKRDRQQAIRELIATASIGSQGELVDRLNARGFAVTQATVSRDIAELGLVKVARASGHVYVTPETLAGSSGTASTPGRAPAASDDRLSRILADIPVTIGRSGLILLVTGSPGTASVIAQAIDESSLSEQEGTLAGDNTLLVLFADEARLLAWRDRFDQIRSSAVEGSRS
jgi:transcriptional regulator of arginine metabolism